MRRYSTRFLSKQGALCLIGGIGLMTAAHIAARTRPEPSTDWAVHGGDAGGSHYSPLVQITPHNVASLAVAWQFDAGIGGLQTSPLVVDGKLFAVTTTMDVVALDATTGQVLWKHAVPDALQQPVRGLTIWRDGAQQRLLVGLGQWLVALDPATGKRVDGFGVDGRIDMRKGLGRSDPASDAMPIAMTSPGVIWRDTIIAGFRTAEGKPAAPGVVRAYDVRSGSLRWTFDILPRPDQPGSETWAPGSLRNAGAANAWAGMVIDDRRGIVFVPTGSAADDFYGADRTGANLYANSLVALDAATGKRLWHYQLVHHDIWDRDLPSPPVLLTVTRGGKRIDAVAQATKQGFLFLFDRVSGAPLFPIEERAFPASSVPGEDAWPTQPVPFLPEPFARQRLTQDLLTRRTPEAYEAVSDDFGQMRSDGPFVPFASDKPTVIFPGFDGGAEWGGQAVDPNSGILFVNANDVPWTGMLAPASLVSENSGEALYQMHCAACHGMDRKGSPPTFPSLDNIMVRKLEGEVIAVVVRGKGRMPGFSQLSQAQLLALLDYFRHSTAERPEMAAGKPTSNAPSRYVFTGYRRFVDPQGYPAVRPPWGTLSAIDMNDGRTLWRVPLGRYPELAKAGKPDTGSENYGGPLLTSSGVLFIGATIYDNAFRAIDSRQGRVLWETTLPYAGVATPVSYMVGGRQFVVIATSGARNPAGPQGSAYVAFALPQATARP